MVLRSIPSCTISHSGDISRSLLTCDTVCAMAASTSASVVKRPRPYLQGGRDRVETGREEGQRREEHGRKGGR